MNIEGNKSGGRLYLSMDHQSYDADNALPPPVSSYPQINVNSKRKKNQKRKSSSNSMNEE
jgi:hypothetical protein